MARLMAPSLSLSRLAAAALKRLPSGTPMTMAPVFNGRGFGEIDFHERALPDSVIKGFALTCPLLYDPRDKEKWDVRSARGASKSARPFHNCPENSKECLSASGWQDYNPARSMRKIAFLYVLRQLAWATVLVCVGLTCVIWLTQSLHFVDLIVNRGIDLSAFVSLTLYLLPTYLVIVIPIAFFAAVLFTYNKLIVDSELIVLRAAGLRPQTLAAPALVLALMLTAICYSATLYFLPNSYREFKDLQFLFRHSYSAVLLREGCL